MKKIYDLELVHGIRENDKIIVFQLPFRFVIIGAKYFNMK